MESITWRWRHFETMSAPQWHEILALRASIFVVEQACPYQDPDRKDTLSWHLAGHRNGELVASMRVVPPGISYEECSIGRVSVPTVHRGKQLGRELMLVGMAFCQSRWDGGIRISGQGYLKGFYESLGFETIHGPYMEDDIPHFEMLLR